MAVFFTLLDSTSFCHGSTSFHLPLLHLIMLDSTSFYQKSTSLYLALIWFYFYVPLLDCTSFYTKDLLYSTSFVNRYIAIIHSTWLYFILPWVYFILPYSTSFYHGSIPLYSSLLHSTMHGSTTLYLTLLHSIPWLHFTLFDSSSFQGSSLYHGRS